MTTALSSNLPARLHLQLCSPAEVSALQGSGGLSPWLSADEQAMVARLRSTQRRHDWLAGRLAAKRVIAQYLAKEHQFIATSSQIIVDYDAQGRPRPRLLASVGCPSSKVEQALEKISLSLAHSAGWGLAGLVHWPSSGRVGVDLQCIRPVRIDLARRLLHTAEARQLAKLFPDRENEGLIVYWTVKEAALKALGSGLRLPMRALYVDLAAHGGHAQLRAELPHGSLCADARYWAEPQGFQVAAVLVRDLV